MNLSRRPLLAFLTAIALLAIGTAQAQSPAEARAEQAMARLSSQYQQLWAGMTPAQKRAFSLDERRWLNLGRWDEQKRCVARASTAGSELRDDELIAACQAEVLEQRLRQLVHRSPLVVS